MKGPFFPVVPNFIQKDSQSGAKLDIYLAGGAQAGGPPTAPATRAV